MTTTTTRRAVLAGIPAAALVPTAAVAVTVADDPIFAAIEAHKAAFIDKAKVGLVYSDMRSDHPEHDETYWENEDASDVLHEMTGRLVETEPTTMAGLLAFLDYVAAFKDGAIGVEGWRSSPCMWPQDLNDEGDAMFAFNLLAKVGNTLRALAVQA